MSTVIKKKIGKYTVEVSNPDKILFPKAKITKQEFVEYYERIAPIILPHVKNRPITMMRFPDGVMAKAKLFYQKDAADYFPDFIAIQPVKRSTGALIDYVLCNNAATLVYLANLVCVLHTWLSRSPKLNYPDRMTFDLDPGAGVDFSLVKWAAKELKTVLEKIGLPTFLMTTGSKGLHVVVPIKRLYLFDDVRAFAQNIAQVLVDQYPDKLTLEIRKIKRKKKIFIDTLRNAWSATAVAPYAVRAKPGAPIATPLKWQELSGLKTPQKYTIKNIFQRLSRSGDLWKDIDKKAVALMQAQKKIARMMKGNE